MQQAVPTLSSERALNSIYLLCHKLIASGILNLECTVLPSCRKSETAPGLLEEGREEMILLEAKLVCHDHVEVVAALGLVHRPAWTSGRSGREGIRRERRAAAALRLHRRASAAEAPPSRLAWPRSQRGLSTDHGRAVPGRGAETSHPGDSGEWMERFSRRRRRRDLGEVVGDGAGQGKVGFQSKNVILIYVFF